MKKACLFFLFLPFTGVGASAQKLPGTIRGTLQDSFSQSLPEATVSVMGAKDSALISFTLTSNSGFFEIKNLDTGAFYLIVSYLGFETLKKPFSVTFEKAYIDLGAIKMERAYKTLGEVVVADEAPIKIKGDTLAFNANFFKTKPNATVEDLIKKLPGMSVEKDGTVKAQGENVQKVYVDGKEFFSNDPKLATKNLTADMIDQVELFDDVSEQSRFNRIDDGSRSKAINLKLKKDKKKGVFGKAHAGYGTDQRYDAGVTANLFRGATQLSLITKANSTNNIGFTLSDMMGMFGGSGGGRGMVSGGGVFGGGTAGGMQVMSPGSIGPGGNMGGFNVGNNGGTGITSSWQAGLNYRDSWSPKADVNGSYFFNRASTNNVSKTARQTFFVDSSINRDQQSTSQNENNHHRINFNLVYQIDSFNSIIFTPNLNLQNSRTYREDTLSQYGVKNNLSYLLNTTRNTNDKAGEGFNWTNNLIWRRKLNKIGRTLSVNLSHTYGQNSRDGFVYSQSNFYSTRGLKLRENNFRQQNLQENSTSNYGVSVSFTEPIARNKIWELNYSYHNNQSEADRRTLDFNTSSGEFDIPNRGLTNHFQNKNESNRFGTNFRVINKKYNYQVGVGVQNTLLKSDNLSKGSITSQRFTNLFPTANFNYQFARSRSLRFNYRGRTNAPSISQLQDVPDYTNAPIIRSGNPNLKQEFTNNVTLSYNFFDIVKFRNLFALITVGNTYNKIVDSINNIGGGAQFIRPTNMDGTYHVTGAFNIGFPVKMMKGGNFTTNTRISLYRNGNITDGVKNYTRNVTIGEDLRLNYNYKDKLDMGLSTSINYTAAKYTIQKNQNTSFFTYVYSGDVSYTFKKGFILSTDFDYTLNNGVSEGFNRDFAMWNASFAKQFLKSKRGELKLSVFDILDQNQSISRHVGENYIEDVQNTVLQRFFMLTFTYNLNRMGGKSIMPRMLERGTRNLRLTQ